MVRPEQFKHDKLTFGYEYYPLDVSAIQTPNRLIHSVGGRGRLVGGTFRLWWIRIQATYAGFSRTVASTRAGVCSRWGPQGSSPHRGYKPLFADARSPIHE